MRKELQLTVVIYLFAIAFIIGNFALPLVNRTIPMDSPVGLNFSILPKPASGEKPNYQVYGFLPYWELDNAGYLQLDKLTDIAYFALAINPNGSIQTDEPGYNNWKNNDELPQLIQSSKTAGVRFALTIISHVDDTTYQFLDCRNCWDNLLKNIEIELSQKKIRDVNLDFELATADAKDGYATKYSQFVLFLNENLDRKFKDSTVTVSVLADSSVKPRITDVGSLTHAADFLFVMAYDFHRPDSDNAGPVAPIGGAGSLWEYDITTMLSDFLKIAPAEKLILGVPYYGYNWLVSSDKDYATRIPGTDDLGYSISQTYSAIADTRLKYNPQVMWDPVGLVPYFTYFNPDYGTTRQVYFEDEKSLAIKYDLAKAKGLAGVGIWALGYDGGYQELWNLLGKSLPK